MTKNTLTQNRIKSNKFLIAVATVIATFTDILVTWLMFDAGYDWIYGLCTWIMLALDILYFISLWLSNYRFKYACVHWVTYIVLSVITIAANIGIFITIPEGSIITYLAGCLWIAVHIFAMCAVIFCAIKASKSVGNSKSFAAMICVLVFIISVGAYAAVSLQNGVFGQGDNKEVRALIFSETTFGGYTVSGVLDGRGDKIIIPNTFNGKKVETVDMSVFSAEKINTVELQCDSDVDFINIEKLSVIPSNLRVEVSKELLNGFRDAFYDMAITYLKASSYNVESTIAENLCNFANSIVPNDLADSDVYIVFNYDLDALETASDNRLPVWIGQKGDVFYLDFYDNSIDYVKYRDQYSDDDLYWNIVNNNGYILSELVDVHGNSIEGKTIVNGVTTINVCFDEIYKLYISEDNDNKYESPDEYKYSTAFGNEKNCRYVTALTAQSVIDAIPKRSGFNLSWQYANSYYGSKRPLTNIVNLLEASNESLAVLYLYPVWELNKPTDIIVASSVANNNPVYGDDIDLIASAVPPVSGYNLQYTWEKEGDLQSNDKDFIIENIYPTQAGVYNLTVTAYSDTETSLTSSAETAITITVAKRALDLSWSLNDGDWPIDNSVVYSALPNTVSYSHNVSQVINNDLITLTSDIDAQGVINAGNYEFNVALTGDSATKYQLNNQCATGRLIIKPYETSVQWQNSIGFVYNGNYQAPVASAAGIRDDVIEVSLRIKNANGVTVSGGSVNAGSYIAEAISGNTNYKLLNTAIEFVIDKAPLDSLEVLLADWIYGDSANLVTVNNNFGDGKINYMYSGTMNDGTEYNSAGIPVNAGSYIVSITVGETLNYKSGTATTDFTILKCKLARPSENDDTFVYNGTEQEYIPVGFDPVTMDITGNIQTSANEIGYTVIVTVANEYNYEWSTVGTDEEIFTYVINKAALKVIADDASVVYGREATFNISYDGFVGSDDKSALDTLPVASSDYSVGTGVKEGPLDIIVSGGESRNYIINYFSGTLIIEKADLTITANDQSVVYGDSIPEYTVAYDGFVNNENESVLEGAINFECDYIPGDGVGEQYINVSGLYSDNYEIKYVAGKIIIDKATLKVIAEDKSVYYGDSAPLYTLTYSGFIGADNEDSLISLPVAGSIYVVGTGVSVDGIEIKVSGGEAANYEFQYVSGTLTVLKTTLTVIADDKTVTYGDAAPIYTVSYEGFVNNENATYLRTEPVAECAYEAGTPVSLSGMAITVSGGNSDNYEFQYEPGSITVNRASLTDKTSGVYGIYNGLAYELSINLDGFVNGENIDSALADITYSEKGGADWSATPPTVTNVNDNKTINYKVVFANYETVSGSQEIKLKPVDINYTWKYADDGYIYNGTEQGPVGNAELNGVIGETLMFTVSAGKVDAGSGYTRIAYFDSVYGGQADKDNYKVTGLVSAEYSIEKAKITVSGVTAYSGIYNGQSHDAITEYSATTVGGQNAAWTFKLDIDDEYSAGMPTFSECGAYKVYYKVSAPNHYDYEAFVIANISKVKLIDETQNVNVVYDGLSHQLDISLSGFVNYENMISAGAAIEYSVNGLEWIDEAITVTDVNDSKTVYYRVTFDNYETVTGNREINIERFEVKYTWKYEAYGYVYTGEEQGPGGDTQMNGVDNEILKFILNEGKTDVGEDYVRTAVFDKVNGGRANKDNYNVKGLTSDKYEIIPATIEVTAVGYEGSYDGNAHEALSMYYAETVGGQNAIWKYKTDPYGEYSLDMPTFIDAGVYKVYYIVSAPNHRDFEGEVTVRILQAENGWATEPHIDDWHYNEVASEPIGDAYYGTVTFTYKQGDETLADKPTDAGNYILIASVEESTNYKGLRDEVSFTIYNVPDLDVGA